MTYTCGKNTTGRIRREVYTEAVTEARTIVVPPTREEIARLAYGYWEARGKPSGSADEDWYGAELELWGRFRNGSR
jgi:Protein of unknown function (DUF2934)